MIRRFSIGFAPDCYYSGDNSRSRHYHSNKRLHSSSNNNLPSSSSFAPIPNSTIAPTWGQGSLVEHLSKLNFTAQEMVDAGLAVVIRSKPKNKSEHNNNNKRSERVAQESLTRMQEEDVEKKVVDLRTRNPPSPSTLASASCSSSKIIEENENRDDDDDKIRETKYGGRKDYDNDEDEDKVVVSLDTIMDRFRGRIMVPILDTHGKHIVGFGGRTLPPPEQLLREATAWANPDRGDNNIVSLSESTPRRRRQGPKYLNSPETLIFHKQQLLFGHPSVLLLNKKKNSRDSDCDPIDKVRTKSDALVVVEGYLDAISLSSAGIEEVVATMGTSISVTQLELAAEIAMDLSLSNNRLDHAAGGRRRHGIVILCLDQDEAGQLALERLCREGTLAKVEAQVLESGGAVEFRMAGLPAKWKDPATLVEHELHKIKEEGKLKRVSTTKDALDKKMEEEERLACLEDRVRAQVFAPTIPWTEWYIQRILRVLSSSVEDASAEHEEETQEKTIEEGGTEDRERRNKQMRQREEVFQKLAALLSDQPKNNNKRYNLAHFAASTWVAASTKPNATNPSSSRTQQSVASADLSLASSPTQLLRDELASGLLDLASRMEAICSSSSSSSSSNNNDMKITSNRRSLVRDIKKGTKPLEALFHPRGPGGGGGRVPDLPISEKLSAQAASAAGELSSKREKQRSSIVPETTTAKELPVRQKREESRSKTVLTPHYSGMEFANPTDREWLESTNPPGGRRRQGKEGPLLALGQRSRQGRLRREQLGKTHSNNWGGRDSFRSVFFGSNEWHGKFVTDEAINAGYTNDSANIMKAIPSLLFERGVGILAERDTNSVACIVENALLRELILHPPARTYVKQWYQGKETMRRESVTQGDDDHKQNIQEHFQWSTKEKMWLFHALVLDGNTNLDRAGANRPHAVRIVLSTRDDVPRGAFSTSSDELSSTNVISEGTLEDLFVELSTMEVELSSSSSSPTHMDYNLQAPWGICRGYRLDENLNQFNWNSLSYPKSLQPLLNHLLMGCPCMTTTKTTMQYADRRRNKMRDQ